MSLSDLEQIPSYEWPDSAGAEIVRVITDRTAHADDRLLAAHLAQEYPGINDLMMGALSGVAGNPAESPELRSSAARAPLRTYIPRPRILSTNCSSARPW